MPGAFTPTEILTAYEAGADIVKIFPAEIVGPAYFKAIRGPLPQVRMMPTGGVDTTTAEKFLDAGACCLGMGSMLIDPKALAAGDMAKIRESAAKYRAIVDAWRAKNK
jgi:2-dehydro-3-deoxyphosphogluconate aldolase/(4S)-4-hydroxy-2-oxoglutarate aldolase